jgi:hypothetical protein
MRVRSSCQKYEPRIGPCRPSCRRRAPRASRRRPQASCKAADTAAGSVLTEPRCTAATRLTLPAVYQTMIIS